MQFTPEMEAAYQRGLESSRREHRRTSTIGQSLPYGFRWRALWSISVRFPASLRAPNELVEAYRSENEQAAFCAGWVDGAGVLSELSVRTALEKISGWAT